MLRELKLVIMRLSRKGLHVGLVFFFLNLARGTMKQRLKKALRVIVIQSSLTGKPGSV